MKATKSAVCHANLAGQTLLDYPIPLSLLTYRFYSNQSVPLEVLHRALVFLRTSTRLERAKIPPLARLRILLPRI
jgi:hypothetical protein